VTAEQLGVRLTSLAEELGAEVLPSQADFVLVRFPDSELVWRGCRALGIALEQVTREPELAPWLRLTLPVSEHDLDRLCSCLRTVRRPEALLFDMDGVLADVSGSYRQAIIRTCSLFGASIGPEDIRQAKAAGNANNDWELTQRLLARHGVEAPLDAVTERFEELYQGTADIPGLYTTERPLLTDQQLAALAQRYQLGVVTGRPRADARRFLDEHGLGEHFAVLVALEDGPLKPDPAPVRRALEQLGVHSAWLLGDTVDDIAAARAAGVLPVGVVAPGEEPAGSRQTLTEAGAVMVLSCTAQIVEVAP